MTDTVTVDKNHWSELHNQIKEYGTITNKKAVLDCPTNKLLCRLGRDRLWDVGFRSLIQPTIFEPFEAKLDMVETQHVISFLLGPRTVIYDFCW